MMKLHTLSREELWLALFGLVIGLFHVFLPGYAEALYDWEYMQQFWQDEDVQEILDPCPTHDFDASLLSFRLMGIAFMALVGFVIWYR